MTLTTTDSKDVTFAVEAVPTKKDEPKATPNVQFSMKSAQESVTLAFTEINAFMSRAE